MRPEVLHSPAEVEALLRRDTFLHIYGIGDLDPFFWPHTTWYALKEAETVRAVVLLYTGGALPVLLALAGDNLPLMGDLLQPLLHLLPRRFYCHLSAALDRTLAQEYRLEEHGEHLKMALRDKTLLAGIDTSNVVRLSTADVSDMLALYEESYPGHWFEPRMLETEQYYGIRGRDALISVAGVHVYSPRYGLAALGNITTHPRYRGRGYGTTVTAGLCKGLSETVEHIGLNVKADNRAALACYGKLGFEACASYWEYTAELRQPGPAANPH